MSLPTTSSSLRPPLPGSAAIPDWSALVKRSLSPRLVRLPILCLLFLHSALCLLHLPISFNIGVQVVLLTLRPTLVLCSLLAFLTGIFPTLVIRRRILARAKWQAALCPTESVTSQIITLPFGIKISSSTALGQLLHRLSLSSTWRSAALEGLTSLMSNAFFLASFAAYSADPFWWLPYQHVPSTRKTTGSFGRTVTTTTHHWRPNEVVCVLLLQPFLVGAVASLFAAALPQELWPIPPLRVPRFPTSLIDALPSVSGTAPSNTLSTLSKRISSTLPPLILQAGLNYLVLSTALLLIYLPLRLPFFRLLLILLPPYSTLRRLVIPSLRSGYGLTTPSHLATLFLTSSACALLQGATRTLAANLWEIYATHPLAITATQVGSPMAQGGSGRSLEVMIGALETYTRQSASTSVEGSPETRQYESDAERSFLFTHALFDFAALCTDTTTQGAEVRRSFFKHFASSTLTSAKSNGATVSAWERVSEVLLGVVESAVGEWEEGVQSSGSPSGLPLDDRNGVNSSVAIAARSQGKELEVAKGGVLGSTPSPGTSARPAAAAAARPAQAQSSALAAASSSATGSQSTTVWQRLVAPPPSRTTGESPSSSTLSRAPASQSASPPSSTPSLVAPLASTIQELITRGKSLLPSRLAPYLPPSFAAATSASAIPSASHPTAPVILLHLLLIIHATYTLLLLSLQEDEWGSVTLSERRSLGVEKWVSVGGRVEKNAVGRLGTGKQADEETEPAKQGASAAAKDLQWEWRLLLGEVRRGREAVLREFDLAG